MNNKDKEYFSELKTSMNLLDVNWKALESNPPCKRNITEMIEYMKTSFNKWENQIKGDDKRYLKVREYAKKKKEQNYLFF